jgi:4-hydroxybenzoate polyprenyltransferase
MRTAAQTEEATSRKEGRIIRYCKSIYLTIRISTLGFTLLLPLLGAVSAQRELTGTTILSMVAVGLAFHIFAYVLNDVADLWLDRTEPLRSDSPLVQGAIGRRKALWLALSQPPLAFAFAVLASVSSSALLMLAVAFLALAGYDLYGKRCPWPLLTDALEAAGFCALVLFGALAQATSLRADAPWLLAYVFFYVLLMTGIHGGVRDLANDFARGARTSAIWLGARPSEGSGVKLSRTLTAYGLLLQGALVASALLALDALEHAQIGHWLANWLVVAGLSVSTVTLLALFMRLGNRRDLVAAGTLHTVVTLAVLPALYVPMLSPVAAAAVLGAFALPVIAMYLYNGSHWCL